MYVIAGCCLPGLFVCLTDGKQCFIDIVSQCLCMITYYGVHSMFCFVTECEDTTKCAMHRCHCY